MPQSTLPLPSRLGLKTAPIYLMDGSAFIFRGFYASRNMYRSDGFPTNALVIVGKMLLSILRDEDPKYFAFFKDGHARTFRHKLYSEYKANRHVMPDELVCQLEPIQRLVSALGIRFEESCGYEADDCIASLATKFSDTHPVIIISADKDLKQCLKDNVFLWNPGSRDESLISHKDFENQTGISPASWPDFQALTGDTSDNIPGIPGIGPKTASRIFQTYSSLEEIREHIDALAPRLQAKLLPEIDKAFFWRQLTRLKTNQCLTITLNDLELKKPDLQACRAIAEEFELTAFFREFVRYYQSRYANDAPIDAQKNTPPTGNGENNIDGYAVETEPPLDYSVPHKLIPIMRRGELPSCKNLHVAVWWPEKDDWAHIAISPYAEDRGMGETTGDYVWHGSHEELCQWLVNAQQIIIFELKPLLRFHAAWRNLLKTAGIKRFFDISLGAYLLDTERDDYSYERVAAQWCPSAALCKNAPAAASISMAWRIEKQLEISQLLGLYNTIEMPLVPVLAAMELNGILIDTQAFSQFLEEVQTHLDQLTQKIFMEAGEEFNIRSSQQLASILYSKLELPPTTRTGAGRDSTSQQALEKLASLHPIVDQILQYRKLEKIRSTYLLPLPQQMDGSNRLHTTFNQKGTATGRISSSHPNLQNIPVRGPLGKRMRSCFIAGHGRLLVSADYSQIELRVLAHFSLDSSLLAAFHAGEDIHTRTAALIFDEAPEKISADQRRVAKTINFGLIYGMGAQKLARELKISSSQAKDFIERYFKRLSGLKSFYETVEKDARQAGAVTTLGGRRRLLPNLLSGNGQTYALGRRQAINTVIQGSAADIIKEAMLAVANDAMLQELGCRLLLQIHDELLLDSPREVASIAGERIAALMSNVKPGGQSLSVPLQVDWAAALNWGEAH